MLDMKGKTLRESFGAALSAPQRLERKERRGELIAAEPRFASRLVRENDSTSQELGTQYPVFG